MCAPTSQDLGVDGVSPDRHAFLVGGIVTVALVVVTAANACDLLPGGSKGFDVSHRNENVFSNGGIASLVLHVVVGDGAVFDHGMYRSRDDDANRSKFSIALERFMPYC